MSPAATHWSFCCSRIAIAIASSRLTARSCRELLHLSRAPAAVPRYPSLLPLMSYLKWSPASSDPSAFCGLYSRSTLANCSATLSAVAAASPAPLGLTLGDDDVVHLDDQELLLALAGLAHRDRRFLDVLAGRARLQQDRRRLVDVMGEVEVVEARLALRRRRRRAPIEPLCVTPQDHESTSTSSLCLASSDSPLMSPIFAKMSAAIGDLLPTVPLALAGVAEIDQPAVVEHTTARSRRKCPVSPRS